MDSTTDPAIAPPTPRFTLINRNFTYLWIGQGVSNVGDMVFDTTLILWIATGLAHGKSWGPLAVSGVLLAVLIPTVAFGSLAGVFVDRWDKRRTMVAMDAMRAAIIVLLLPLTGLVSIGLHPSAQWQLGLVYSAVVATTLCSLFFGPARVALIGDVVTAAERGRASGLGQMTQHLAALIGPPLAGPIYFTLGARWALIANALSFALSLAMIACVQAPLAARSLAAGARGHAWREAREGLRFFADNPVLVALTVSAVILMLGAGSLQALDVYFLTGTLHASPGLYGLMSAAIGAGALLGAILISSFAARLNMARVFWMSILLTSLLITAYSRMTVFVPALVILFLAGIPMAALNVALMPLVLQVTPRELIGRVAGVLQPSVSLASVVGIAIAGGLAGTVLRGFRAEIFGMTFRTIDSIFTAAGLLGLGAGVYALFALRGVSESEHRSGMRAHGESADRSA